MQTKLVLALLAPPLLASLAACSSSGTGSRNAPRTETTAHSDMSPLHRSALRERAIAELESQAFAEWALLRANAMEGLSGAPSRAQGVVRAGLADDNQGVRAIAAMLAGEMRLTELVPSLRAMTEDPSPLVRTGAIAALAMMGQEVDQSPLAQMLQHDREDVRRQAAFALGEIGNSSAIPLLRSAVRGTPMGSRGAIFRMQAAEAMVKLGDKDAINALRAGLYPSETEEIEAAVLAAQILGEVGDVGSAKQLVEIIEFTRNGRTGSANSSADYLYPPELRLAAATAMVKLGFEPRGYIGTAFQESPVPTVRAQVAFLYGEIGSGEFLQRLELLMSDNDPLVRISASSAVVDALAVR